jgi:periplasmic divalent cation tolerance protein
MTEERVVLVTAGSREEAERLAEALVGERLAACVNIVGPIRSIYRWQGEVCRDDEQLLLIKTTRPCCEALERRVRELHSYDVPEVIVLPIESGSSPYLAWLREQVS